MQTFLALLLRHSGRKISASKLYRHFRRCANLLDYKRLGKQRVEAMQLLKAMDQENNKWKRHPAYKQWRSYRSALKVYINAHIDEWIEQGYNNTMEKYDVKGNIRYPAFLTNKLFVEMHQRNLLLKNFGYYSQHGWKVKPAEKGGYYWYSRDSNKKDQYIYTQGDNAMTVDLSGRKHPSLDFADATDERCPRQIRQGKRKGQVCSGKVYEKGYCNKCLKLKSVKKILGEI